MDTDRKPEAATPWYLRGKTLLITAGALAAATLGILNLWDRIFPADEQDVARVESVVITKQSSLGDFTAGDLAKDFHLEPAPEGAGPPRTVVNAGTPIPDRKRAPTEPPLSPVHSSVTPTPTPTPSPSPTPGPVTPTPTPPPTTGTPTPSFTETSIEQLLQQRLAPDYVSKVVERPELGGFDDDAVEHMPDVAYSLSVQSQAEGKAGEPVPPEQVATILAAAFAEVESIEDPTGLDPLGWTVAVRLNLEGVSGEPLLLTWSLDGVDVPENWKAEKLAYRVVASTPHDAGTVELWIPDLSVPGTYNVNVRLVFEANGDTADIGTLTLPQN